MGGQRTLIGIVAGVVALLVLSVGTVLLRGEPPAASFAPDSPPAALQAYVAAWDGGDAATAWAAFSRRVQATTSESDYRDAFELMRAKGVSPERGRRVYFDEVRITGDAAQVRITVEMADVGGLSVQRYRTSHAVAMVREAGAWKIDQALVGLEPWEFPPRIGGLEVRRW